MQQRQIPASKSFSDVADYIRRVVSHKPIIEGGIILGSVLTRTTTIRSDVDFLYVYDPSRVMEVVGVMQEIDQLAKELFVPVDFIPITTDIASRTNQHTIGPSFRDNLDFAVDLGGVVENNPLKLFPFYGPSLPIEDVCSYISRKLHTFEKAMVSFPRWDVMRQCLLLQKALEAPVHIARKVLFLRGISSREVPTKGHLIEAYCAANDSQLGDILHRLVSVDRAYSRRCNQCLTDETVLHLYPEWVRDVAGCLPSVVEFARLNLLNLCDLS